MVVNLSFNEYLMVFGYLFLPIAVFAVLLFGSIILSNRMGGQNKLIVFFVRFILVSGLLVALLYYFYYFANNILING